MAGRSTGVETFLGGIVYRSGNDEVLHRTAEVLEHGSGHGNGVAVAVDGAGKGDGQSGIYLDVGCEIVLAGGIGGFCQRSDSGAFGLIAGGDFSDFCRIGSGAYSDDHK